MVADSGPEDGCFQNLPST